MVSDFFLYFAPFLIAFSVSLSLLFYVDWTVRRVDAGRARFFKRLGGVALLISFVLATVSHHSLVLSLPIVGILAGCIGIAIFGVFDDWFSFGWKPQLAFQCILILLLLAFGFRIVSIPIPFVGTLFLQHGFWQEVWSMAILSLWVVLLVNSLNWADGVDGLLPSIALVSSLVLFLLSLFPDVNQPPLGILSIALFGSALGLFFFNVSPAKAFSGTSGSFGIGFLLASISVASGTKIATILLVASLPMADALWVFCERIFSGASPFIGSDRRHLHYRLKSLGWSDGLIVSLYASITVGVGIIALLTQSMGKFIAIITVFSFAFLSLFWVRRYLGRQQNDRMLPEDILS